MIIIRKSLPAFVAVLWLSAPLAYAQAIETAKVTAQSSARSVQLPGELLPFQAAALSARVSGFVETITVDRGSIVKRGDVLATLSAPELAAQTAEAQSRVLLAEASRAEAESRLAAATASLDRLKRAAATPGTVAGLELIRAEDEVTAQRAAVETRTQALQAAKASLNAVRALEQYRTIVAPFAGRITERLVHPGALVGPAAGPLLKIEQTTKLRLVLPVPEHDLGTVTIGRSLEFRVTALPGKTFSARLARSSGSLDPRTRSMTIEADVDNGAELLAPGMFPDVAWPIVREGQALMVPVTAVVTTTERTFVIRVVNGKAEWITVRKGALSGDQVEVMGALKAGDVIVKRGTDEIRDGASVPGSKG